MRCYLMRSGHIAAVEELAGLSDQQAIERCREIFDARKLESKFEGFEVWELARMLIQHREVTTEHGGADITSFGAGDHSGGAAPLEAYPPRVIDADKLTPPSVVAVDFDYDLDEIVGNGARRITLHSAVLEHIEEMKMVLPAGHIRMPVDWFRDEGKEPSIFDAAHLEALAGLPEFRNLK
jgi:hypothetical protein